MTLIPLEGINHLQPILHMSKIMVHCYYTDESINQFAIGYMIYYSLNCNKVFRKHVEIWWIVLFYEKKKENIKDFWRKKNTCVMELIIFFKNNKENPKKCIEC